MLAFIVPDFIEFWITSVLVGVNIFTLGVVCYYEVFLLWGKRSTTLITTGDLNNASGRRRRLLISFLPLCMQIAMVGAWATAAARLALLLQNQNLPMRHWLAFMNVFFIVFIVSAYLIIMYHRSIAFFLSSRQPTISSFVIWFLSLMAFIFYSLSNFTFFALTVLETMVSQSDVVISITQILSNYVFVAFSALGGFCSITVDIFYLAHFQFFLRQARQVLGAQAMDEQLLIFSQFGAASSIMNILALVCYVFASTLTNDFYSPCFMFLNLTVWLLNRMRARLDDTRINGSSFRRFSSASLGGGVPSPSSNNTLNLNSVNLNNSSNSAQIATDFAATTNADDFSKEANIANPRYSNSRIVPRHPSTYGAGSLRRVSNGGRKVFLESTENLHESLNSDILSSSYGSNNGISSSLNSNENSAIKTGRTSNLGSSLLSDSDTTNANNVTTIDLTESLINEPMHNQNNYRNRHIMQVRSDEVNDSGANSLSYSLTVLDQNRPSSNN